MYVQKTRPEPIGSVKVVTPGTPVPLVSTLIANGVCLNGDTVTVNKIDVMADPDNAGRVYIGTAGMVKATRLNVITILKPGDDWGITNNVSVNSYNFATLFVDADNANDGIFGSIDEN
ncbi:MAG TPA: hypothetical protein VG297_13485 [Bryobacteraceae bacterium]|jgi:hypothetical protein|nr:hypothetical protein [Bryobacteraceae bacterium]